MPATKRWALFKKTSRTGLPLWAEIALVLVVKVALLFFLWKAFFSHPQTKHMVLPTPVVEQHLLSPKPAALNRVRHAYQMFVYQRAVRWRTLLTFQIKETHGSH